MSKRKPYVRKCWGGFVAGRLHYTMIDTGFGGWGSGGMMTMAVFTNKAIAERQYEDVRQIEIREVPR